MSAVPAALPSASRTLSNASWALRVQFFVAGALFATWGVHVPTVKAHYGLSDAALAMAMMSAGIGSLLALMQAGRLIGRWGAPRVALATGLLCTAAIASLIATTHYPLLLAVMLGFGMASSLFDVAINTEATEIEKRSGRPQMSNFHGMFSLGGMAGAAVGSAMPLIGASPQQHLLGAAAVCVAAVAWASRGMLPQCEAPSGKQPLALPRGRLALIGVLAALGLITEGAMYDWSVLFVHEERQAVPSVAALAYACFSGAMAAARFAGDAIRARLDATTLMRWSGAVAALGMSIALLVPHPLAALFGFALVGLGLANVVPTLFSAGAQVPGVTPAHGIAAVASLGYAGMMVGPPLIGMVAEASSLSWGLATVVVFALVMTAAARRALR